MVACIYLLGLNHKSRKLFSWRQPMLGTRSLHGIKISLINILLSKQGYRGHWLSTNQPTAPLSNCDISQQTNLLFPTRNQQLLVLQKPYLWTEY